MSRGLVAVPALMAEVMPRLAPPAAMACAPGSAIGFALAEDIRAPRDSPEAALALIAGHAVAALATIGAAPSSPVIAMPAPPRVLAGEALPPGTDAVLPDFAVSAAGAFAEIIAAAAPGENARLAGQDLRAGAVLAPAGARVGSALALALARAGIASLAIRAPGVVIEGFDDGAADWLRTGVAALGGRMAADAETPAMILSPADGSPRLALAPGETGWIEPGPDGAARVTLPARFDGMVAGFHALAAPVLSHWSGIAPRPVSLPLRRKLASRVGLTEAVLLAEADGEWLPLGIGEITLAGLGAARAIALVGPESEGLAAGSTHAATLLV